MTDDKFAFRGPQMSRRNFMGGSAARAATAATRTEAAVSPEVTWARDYGSAFFHHGFSHTEIAKEMAGSHAEHLVHHMVEGFKHAEKHHDAFNHLLKLKKK